MIQSLKYLLFPLLGSLVISCSSTQNLPVKSTFQFAYEETEYQIISINSPEGDGMNFLTKVERDSTVLKCLDQDQDGFLEVIQYGNLDLTKANLIYQFGIQKAMDAGKFKNQRGYRIFEFSENDTLYTIETFGVYIDQIYNTFTITDLQYNNSAVFIDEGADAQLDIIESGDMKLQQAQEKYRRLLQLGINEAQIHLWDEKYIVKFNTIDRSS